MTREEKLARWKTLCGLAVKICGGQAAFKREANILRRLAKAYGPDRTEHMLKGAQLLGWTTLRSLGSIEGPGRRWAEEKYWEHENRRKQQQAKMPQRLKDIMRGMGE